MKNIIALFTVFLLAFSLAACHKSDPEGAIVEKDNALVVNPGGNGSKAVTYPIKSVFRRSNELSSWTSVRYSFYQEAYTTYPRSDKPFILLSGRVHKGEELTDSVKYLDTITIQGLLRWSVKIGGDFTIPLEEGQYKGGNESVTEVRIESFCSPDTHIVITTVEGDVLVIRYSGEVQ